MDRASERLEVTQLFLDNSQILQLHEVAYVLQIEWWTQWCDYVGFYTDTHGSRPGPISNDTLLSSDGYIADIAERSVLLTQAVWKKLVVWYTGGPELPVCIVNGKADYSPLLLYFETTRTRLFSVPQQSWFSKHLTVAELKAKLCKLAYKPEYKFSLVKLEGGATVLLPLHSTLEEIGVVYGSNLLLEATADQLYQAAELAPATEFSLSNQQQVDVQELTLQGQFATRETRLKPLVKPLGSTLKQYYELLRRVPQSWQ